MLSSVGQVMKAIAKDGARKSWPRSCGQEKLRFWKERDDENRHPTIKTGCTAAGARNSSIAMRHYEHFTTTPPAQYASPVSSLLTLTQESGIELALSQKSAF